MELSADPIEVVDKIVEVLKFNADALGLVDAHYGDMVLIPKFPIVCVEPGNFTRTLQPGSTHRFNIVHNVSLLIYHDKIQESGITRHECDELALAVQNKLHEDFNLDGLVIFGYVTRFTPGTVRKGGVMIYISGLAWTGFSREDF